MKLIKLSDVDTRDFYYIAVENITAVKVEHNKTTYDGNTISATRVDTIGPCYIVRESIAEVLAMVEGRDPMPAKVLYGNRDE